MKKDFLILGNSVSGTSLLKSLLHHHPKIECKFEWFMHKQDIGGSLDAWLDNASKHEKIWGNKIPLEQFFNAKWTDEDIIKLIDHFHIVFIQRRFSMYAKHNANNSMYKAWWTRANHDIYWAMRERAPEKIIAVSFEDLCLRPFVELSRICRFLNITYNKIMLKGTANRKSRVKIEGQFDLTRI